MKKKVFLFLIIFTLLVSLIHIPVLASDDMPVVSPIITMENKEIQYDLPYPGLLPDNPLYFLKRLRDSIEVFFISDPLKKAEFDIQQADKQINTALYLSNEKPVKDPLISSTLEKAITYADEARAKAQEAETRGEHITDIVAKMDLATQKYHQVLLQLQMKASDTLKMDIMHDQKELDNIRKKIVKMEKI